jgi:DNA sulfur modification protein DndD
MILKDIRIKNFRCYYGETVFSLSEGLTLIIGGNGDGKTTFFEALEWLFNTTAEDKKESNISAMRKSELEIGESDEVSVSITFEHEGKKELVKSYTFEKVSADNIRTRDFKFIGYEDEGSERLSVKGANLLEHCFDSFIRKYCLFKGESELNVFNNETALKTLVDTFSGIKQFEDLVSLTEGFEQKSLNAVNKEMQNDQRVSKKAKELDYNLSLLNRDISDCKKDIATQETAIHDYSVKLENLERYQDTSEMYQTIKERIKTLTEKQTKLKGMIYCDYNVNLLDEYWILRSFPKILNEYQKKTSALSREKRKLEKQETERIAKEEGKREAIEQIQKLANGAVPLPWNLPDKETLQEMIDEEVCKVCGREAKKGTAAYEFMKNKLNEYLRHIEIEASSKDISDAREKVLFPNSYIDELHTRQIQMSGSVEQDISNISTEINDRLSFINDRKRDLEKINKEIQDAEDEKNRLLIQSPGITEDLLDKNFKDLKGFIETKSRAEKRVTELKLKLEGLIRKRDEIQAEFNALEPTNAMTKVYQRVHTTFEYIMKAFQNAKETNVITFLAMLEEQANNYLKLLNENDFYGIVRIRRTVDGSARIELYSENGEHISDPGGAQRTTMYMSVLFAISKITTLKREQDYPLIFDAPTSSFELYKEDVFFNVIDKIDKQCIIVTKDLLLFDEATGQKKLNTDKIQQLTCSVYRISKAPNYNPLDLSTIKTETEKIK